MKVIGLSKGKVVLIDDEDFALVSPYRWNAVKGCAGVWYAVGSVPDAHGKRKRILLHRLIMNPPADKDIDHINGDGLDNRRSNLREATDSVNQQNRHHLTTNTNGYRGVSSIAKYGKWQASIKQNGRAHHLGWHDTREAAAAAYDQKARELYGPLAAVNFPDTQNSQPLYTKTTTSPYRGVCWKARDKRFIAKLTLNRTEIYLGSFIDEAEAARAYDAKAMEMFGPSAQLNFPSGT